MSTYGVRNIIEINRIKRKLRWDLCEKYSSNAFFKLIDALNINNLEINININNEEFKKILKKLGLFIPLNELNLLLDNFNKNYCDELNIKEFLNYFLNPLEENRYNKIVKIFNIINSNAKEDFIQYFNFENKLNLDFFKYFADNIDLDSFLLAHNLLSNYLMVDELFLQAIENLWIIKQEVDEVVIDEDLQKIKLKLQKLPNILDFISNFDIEKKGFLNREEFYYFIKSLNLSQDDISYWNKLVNKSNELLTRDKIKKILFN